MALTLIGGSIGVFLEYYDGFVYALAAFVIIDYVTELMIAALI